MSDVFYATPDAAREVGKGEVPVAPPRTSEVLAGSRRGPWELATPETIASLAQQVERYGDRAVDWMMTDPKVKGSVNTLVDAIFADGIQFSPAVTPPAEGEDPDPQREDDARRAKAICEFVERSAASLIPSLPVAARGLAFGAAKYRAMLAEVVLKPGSGRDAGMLVWDRMVEKDRRDWQFGVDAAFGGIVGFYGRDEGGEEVLFGREKFLLCRWFPRAGDVRGTFLMDATMTPWDFKRGVYKKYWNWLDLFSEPGVVGVVGENARPEPRRDANNDPIPGQEVSPTQQLYAGLTAFASAKVVAAPPGTTINPFEVKGNGEAHRKAFEYFDQEIVFSILHVIRATLESEHNSQADSGTAQDMLGLVVRILKVARADEIRQDAVRPLVRVNFGVEAADRLTPRVAMGRTEHQDLASLCGSLASMGAANLLPPQLVPVLLAELLGFPGVDPSMWKGWPPQPAPAGAGNPAPGAPERGAKP